MNPDEDLIQRCLQKDSRAQELLYQRLARKLYGICLRYAGNEMEAEDILQEGFIRIFSNLHSFRSDGSLEGWTARIMVNTAINYFRRSRRQPEETRLNETMIAATISEDVLSRLSRKDIINVIQSLPAGYRTVFNLYVMEGYTHQEIAAVLGITESTSKSQLCRARTAIQHRLAVIMR